MQDLTPFTRRTPQHTSGAIEAPGAASSQNSPPLGVPPGFPDSPGVQPPPPPAPIQGQTPHPGSDSAPAAKHPIPMTDGTPLPCRQKNAREFLQGHSQGIMAQYGEGLFGAQQHTHSAHPAPDEAAQAVRSLVEWREEAPYG